MGRLARWLLEVREVSEETEGGLAVRKGGRVEWSRMENEE
jgi:hypothetical protein